LLFEERYILLKIIGNHRGTLSTKLEILRQVADRAGVDFDLVQRILNLERSRLHPGSREEKHRQEDLKIILMKWADKHQV
jgi:hypothetical protein